MVYSNLPGERDFESHPSGAHEIFTVSFIAQMVEFAAVILLLIIIAACCKDGVMKKVKQDSTMDVSFEQSGGCGSSVGIACDSW